MTTFVHPFSWLQSKFLLADNTRQIYLLKRAVPHFATPKDAKKMPWQKVARFIVDNGGSYQVCPHCRCCWKLYI